MDRLVPTVLSKVPDAGAHDTYRGRLPTPCKDRPMQELEAELAQVKSRLDGLVADGLSADEQVVVLTRAMRQLDDIRTWVTEHRNEAVFEFDTNPMYTESLASLARRSGVTHQALSRIARIMRAERGEL